MWSYPRSDVPAKLSKTRVCPLRYRSTGEWPRTRSNVQPKPALTSSLPVPPCTPLTTQHKPSTTCVPRRVGRNAKEVSCSGSSTCLTGPRSEEHTSELQSRGHLV